MGEILRAGMTVAENVPLLRALTPRARALKEQAARQQKVLQSALTAFVVDKVADSDSLQERAVVSKGHAHWPQLRIDPSIRVVNVLGRSLPDDTEIIAIQGLITEADAAREPSEVTSIRGADKLRLASAQYLENIQNSSRRGARVSKLLARLPPLDPIVVTDSPEAYATGFLGGIDARLEELEEQHEVPREKIAVVNVVNGEFATRQIHSVYPEHFAVSASNPGVLVMAQHQPEPAHMHLVEPRL